MLSQADSSPGRTMMVNTCAPLWYGSPPAAFMIDGDEEPQRGPRRRSHESLQASLPEDHEQDVALLRAQRAQGPPFAHPCADGPAHRVGEDEQA